MSISDKFDAFSEISEKGGIMQKVGTNDVKFIGQCQVVSRDYSRFLERMNCKSRLSVELANLPASRSVNKGILAPHPTHIKRSIEEPGRRM